MCRRESAKPVLGLDDAAAATIGAHLTGLQDLNIGRCTEMRVCPNFIEDDSPTIRASMRGHCWVDETKWLAHRRMFLNRTIGSTSNTHISTCAFKTHAKDRCCASERAASLDQGQPGLAQGDLCTFDAGGHICSVGSDTAGNPAAIRAGELGRDRLLRCRLYAHQVKPYIMRKSSACCCTVEECLLQLYLRDTVLRAACIHGSSTKSSFPTTRPHLVPHPPVV